jgi:hypothetical protein
MRGIFVVLKKCQNVLVTVYDKESMSKKAMEPYQTWLGEGLELSILRM